MTELHWPRLLPGRVIVNDPPYLADPYYGDAYGDIGGGGYGDGSGYGTGLAGGFGDGTGYGDGWSNGRSHLL